VNGEFIERLDRLGFFKYEEPSEVPSLKKHIADEGWAGIFGAARAFPADAEELAEGGIGEFLMEIEPLLERMGVPPPDIEERYDEDGYFLSVNGEDRVIWDTPDLEENERRAGWIWGITSARTFALVNDLLARAGAADRLYAYSGGNEQQAFFLTPELREAVCDHPEATPPERPYIPTEEHPWFGRGHE